MEDKQLTIIVSDLHVGGGPSDPGDDHVYQEDQFENLIHQLGQTPEGHQGNVELIINGDFLELAQVCPEAYALNSAEYWCSEKESLLKLNTILSGHANIFAALTEFQHKGNRVTIAAGNHDVDLYWPGVQHKIQEAAGPVRFELGSVWYWRYGGQLQIGHGHMFDPANAFEHWSNPILTAPSGVPRLEMCPGTLFMVKFVNWLEGQYPFADNIKPVTALGRILWQERQLGLTCVGWMLSQFLARHPRVALGIEAADTQTGDRLVQLIQYHDAFAAELMRLSHHTGKPYTSVEEMRQQLTTQEAIFDFLCRLVLSVSPQEWLPVFDIPGQASLGIGGESSTLSIVRAGMSSDKALFRETAKEELERAPQPAIVVMGHTHQPDTLHTEHGTYFNPGSWTRYVDLEKNQDLTLADLAREEDFPYQLNYVRVEQQEERLEAEMVCYQEEKRAR